MPEFPKKISDNGWYELSNGETVRGEEAARQAEEDLLALPEDGLEEDEFEEELDEGDEVGPLHGTFEQQSELDPTGKKCANCGGDATVVDNPSTANPVFFCDQDRPIYLR